jgi:ElaA protein
MRREGSALYYLRPMHSGWTIKSFHDLSVPELFSLLVLRQEVFVVEQSCAYLDADEKDPLSLHLFLSDDAKRCLACLRIVPPGISYEEVSIGRVATHLSVRRTGLGRELMQVGMTHILRLFGAVPIRISAQSYLQRFYESLGFVKVSEEYLEDDIPHIEMRYTP